MENDWIEGSWFNGSPVLAPLEGYDYFWIYVQGGNHSILIPYKGSPLFFLATQYHAYYQDTDNRESLRWWWKLLTPPEIPNTHEL